MFLLPGLIITMYITKTPVPEEWRIEIIRYICGKASKNDGGWGLHTEGESTVFGTAGNYVALRLLGLEASNPVAIKARNTLHRMGGALYGPQWLKMWLATLNCYKWDGMNPIPPEFWLLPNWIPFHPWRWWIHTRQVYLPMGYLYGGKHSCPVDALIASLRSELYTQPFDEIDFSKYRNSIAAVDNYHPISQVLVKINEVLTVYCRYLRPRIHIDRIAQEHVYDLIKREDANTDYLCLGPVNNPLNTLCTYYAEGPESKSFKRHVERFSDFMWMSSDGMNMNGTNGVQLWDTAFTIQAAVEAGLAQDPRFVPMLKRAHEFVRDCQIKENCREMDKCYRHQRKGAWPFSNRQQGYTVSDCTAEGLKAVVQLQLLPEYPQIVGMERLHDAVDVLLSMQNSSGGFASYEKIRGSALLEHINACEAFGNIMVEYDYPECTTSVVTGLKLFQQYDPNYRAIDISQICEKAIKYIQKSQRQDGSWYGSWGICFTYAAFFATESLASVGQVYENSIHQRKACAFLRQKQRDDGGWSESYKVDYP